MKRAMRHCARNVGREAQPACLDVSFDDRVQPGFVNRNATLFKDANLLRVDVQAQHIVAHFCQARGRDQPHVSGTHNRHFHALLLP
jgi:hypothetical protein